MTGQTIGGLFKDATRGETALAELKKAGFTSAQISELADDESAEPVKKLGNPLTDFFQDHTTTGSEFQDNLTGLGISDADAKYFEDGVARGGALVTVKGDTRASEAVAILQRNGADLGSQGRTNTNASLTAGAPGASSRADVADKTIELKAERLAVDKVRVASGAARITKRVVSEQKSVDVPVMHEELVIERHPVTGAAPSGTIGGDETFSVPLSREEVKVSKQTFATEEVEIGKRSVADTEHVSETIRHEELVVDKDAELPTTKR
ncbi:MAG: YsnF/AvaK domain-containing protein [Candidatus Eremiobacteraeota bacterium]|nr:YsnF/AvaK domain-containing protein [Candidatus Eremiobacteraeota bacterium]